jgi:transposase
MKLSPYVLCLSTFSKNHRIIVPLNPAKYHLDLLGKGDIVDFQLVKHEGCYHAHVCVKYDVPGRAVRSVLGVDLGIRRAMATVLLKPDKPLHREDLSILTDNQKRRHLDLFSRRVAMLQEARKWEPLKRLRHKRIHVAEYFDRIDAIHIAEMAAAEQSMVAVGYPKSIKYEKYRGNGERRLRRMLQQRFPYNRKIQYIQEECAGRGIRAETVLEAWTSRTCHRCGSTNTRRSTQSLFWCLDCSLQYNADWNSSINIGSVFLPAALSRRATEGLAQAGEDSAYKPMSPEIETIVDTVTSTR